MSTRPANIIRHEEAEAFTVVSNNLLNDQRLSLDEKGLLCWYLHLPKDWEIIPAHVRKSHRIGRDKYHRIMKSLRNAGYARLEIERAEDGTIACIRHVISSKPAIPAAAGDAPAIPDERVCEIGDAELEAADGPDDDASLSTEKPDVDLTESALSDSGKPVTRQRTKDLQNTPPTPQTVPAAKPPPSFRALCAKWPSDRIVSVSDAERRYLRLSEDRRQQAFDGVERYLAQTRAKGWKICDLQSYLRGRRWEQVKAGPPSACSMALPGSPQAARWLDYWTATGQPTDFARQQLRMGRPITTPTEWPPAVSPAPPAKRTG